MGHHNGGFHVTSRDEILADQKAKQAQTVADQTARAKAIVTGREYWHVGWEAARVLKEKIQNGEFVATD